MKKKTFIKYGTKDTVISGVTVKADRKPTGEGWVEIPSTLCCVTIPNAGISRNKAFVKFTKSGDVVPGSLIIRKTKPTSGKWMEVPYKRCCIYIPPPSPLVPIPDEILGAVGDSVEVEVQQDGIYVEITAAVSSDEDVATVTVFEGVATVELVGEGTATITLTVGTQTTTVVVTSTTADD